MQNERNIKIKLNGWKEEQKKIQEAIKNRTEDWQMLEQMEDWLPELKERIELLEWVLR